MHMPHMHAHLKRKETLDFEIQSPLVTVYQRKENKVGKMTLSPLVLSHLYKGDKCKCLEDTEITKKFCKMNVPFFCNTYCNKNEDCIFLCDS